MIDEYKDFTEGKIRTTPSGDSVTDNVKFTIQME